MMMKHCVLEKHNIAYGLAQDEDAMRNEDKQRGER